MPIVATVGSNRFGQLGRVGEESRFATVTLPEDIIQVACGQHHTIAVSNRGSVFGWGRNSEGQLGLPHDIAIQPTPVRLLRSCDSETSRESLGDLHVVRVAAGENHSMFLSSEGEVLVVGSGACGQHGNGSLTTCTSFPVKVALPEIVVDIAAAYRACFALTGAGVVYAWGESTSGLMGTPSVPLPWVTTPHRLQIGPARTRISRVVASESYAVYLSVSRDAVGAGSNASNALLLSDSTSSGDGGWKPLTYPSRVHDVACGLTHMIASTHNGKLVLSGADPNGASLFASVSVSGCVGIAAGRHSSFWWSASGELFACGKNHHNQLGLNVASVSSFQRVPLDNLGDVVAVSCGASHTTVLLAELGSRGEDNGGMFVCLEDQEEDAPRVANSSLTMRWDEDISNVSFSRAPCSRAFDTQVTPNHASHSNGASEEATASSLSSSSRHDAFWNTKLILSTVVVSSCALLTGIALGKRWKALH